MKIVFSSNISWSIYNFRTPLLKSLQKDGHIIYTVASKDKYADKLIDEGFFFDEVKLNNNSKNPFEDIKLVFQYYNLYKKIKPDVICHNAIKPNIYGTIAAKFLGIPVVNNISGLGTLFIKESLSTKIAKFLYKVSQRKADKVFFQNTEDYQEFLKNNLVKEGICEIIPGSGVNTELFIPKKNEERMLFRFIFIGRLLFDKGILEYIKALRILKKKYSNFEGTMLGPIYQSNNTAITEENLKEWIKEGVVNYLGITDNIVEFMQEADCLVLPSYREGLSKVLIEASSVGVPIITTNVPGCKDVVVNEVTGLLCEAKNVNDLAMKMEEMLNYDEKKRKEMGLNARKRAIAFFDEKIIINQYKNAINKVVKNS